MIRQKQTNTRTHTYYVYVYTGVSAHTHSHTESCIIAFPLCPAVPCTSRYVKSEKKKRSSNTKTSQNNSRQLRQHPLLCSAPSLPPSLLPSYPRRAIAVSNSSCVAVSLVANHFQKLLFTVVDFLQRLQKMQHKKKQQQRRQRYHVNVVFFSTNCMHIKDTTGYLAYVRASIHTHACVCVCVCVSCTCRHFQVCL